jgi:hypothetical protein
MGPPSVCTATRRMLVGFLRLRQKIMLWAQRPKRRNFGFGLWNNPLPTFV